MKPATRIPPRQRFPRQGRARRAMPHQLSPRDRELLALLDRMPFLTADQLCRVVFGHLSALSYCRDRLKRLYHAHLVHRLFLAHVAHGSPLTVYTKRQRPPHARGFFFLAHTLAVADFVVGLDAWTRGSALMLTDVLLERELRRAPVRVPDGDRLTPVIPDAYLRLILDGRYELAWCLELDRGTESSRVVRRKIARYLGFAAGPYQAAFGTSALTIVIVTTAGARRLAHLLSATEDELEAAGQTDQADLFRLTSANLQHESPRSLFASRRWWIPLRAEPVALLPEVD